MTEGPEGRAAFGLKSAEIAVSLAFFALGALVVFDSRRLGAGWADDGPQAGYFPFYVGLIICASAVFNLVRALRMRPERDIGFVEVGQLRLVLSVLIPAIAYVAVIGWLGIYAASAAFVAFFMRWLGKYGWWKLAAVAVGNSVFFFLVFEIWFKVPLPKGPLEAWLGLN
jgi:putative tricarboxylic transport membrane protein